MIWLYLLALAIALLAGATLFGLTLPREHLVSRTLQLQRPAAEVFAVLADFAGHPRWRRSLTAVEAAGERHGRPAWREVHARGRDVHLEVLESFPPTRLVTVLSGARGGFCGSWQFDLSPSPRGCWVHLTERTGARKPLLRFALRYLWPRSHALETFLRDLAARFGERPVLE